MAPVQAGLTSEEAVLVQMKESSFREAHTNVLLVKLHTACCKWMNGHCSWIEYNFNIVFLFKDVFVLFNGLPSVLLLEMVMM